MSKNEIIFVLTLFIFNFIYCEKENIQEIKKDNSLSIEQKIKEDIKKALLENAIVIDVRTPEEFHSGHFKNALNIPHDQIEQNLQKLEKYRDKTIIVYCRSGRRSNIAKDILEMKGFKKVINGINLSYFPED